METEEGGFSTENYLHVSLEIPGNIGSALYYKEQLSGLLSSYKWPGEVNLELLGILRGKLSEKEEEKVQKTLLKSFEETVQIAFTYDEERDRTEVRLGLPFIRGDY